jgi:hypothetical protein
MGLDKIKINYEQIEDRLNEVIINRKQNLDLDKDIPILEWNNLKRKIAYLEEEYKSFTKKLQDIIGI